MRRPALQQLVVGGPPEIVPRFESMLSAASRDRLAGRLTVEVGSASPDEIALRRCPPSLLSVVTGGAFAGGIPLPSRDPQHDFAEAIRCRQAMCRGGEVVQVMDGVDGGTPGGA